MAGNVVVDLDRARRRHPSRRTQEPAHQDVLDTSPPGAALHPAGRSADLPLSLRRMAADPVVDLGVWRAERELPF